MEIIKVENDHIKISERMRQWLGSHHELLAFTEGDTLFLKRITIPSLVEIVTDTQPPPLQEIVEETKRYRRKST